MKLIGVLMLGLLTSFSAFASPEIIKTCDTVLTSPESQTIQIPTLIEIMSEDGTLRAKITQTAQGITGSYYESVQISRNDVRAGLTAETDADDLNLGEALIVHAMQLTEDPIFGGAFSAGMTLKEVRQVKIFLLGTPETMGASAIVQAQDSAGNDLGSFLGGFLVSACK